MTTKTDAMPISNVEWVDRDTLTANDYNPNNVFRPEMKLLKTSLLQDGWSIPLIINEKNEIIDGFHRWTLSGDKDIRKLTDGLVPVVRLKGISKASQIASTIRYNRTRGVHHVLKMSDIVINLKDKLKQSDDQIAEALGMEVLEVKLLYERGSMIKRASAKEFGKAWKPGEKEKEKAS